MHQQDHTSRISADDGNRQHRAKAFFVGERLLPGTEQFLHRLAFAQRQHRCRIHVLSRQGEHALVALTMAVAN